MTQIRTRRGKSVKLLCTGRRKRTRVACWVAPFTFQNVSILSCWLTQLHVSRDCRCSRTTSRSGSGVCRRSTDLARKRFSVRGWPSSIRSFAVTTIRASVLSASRRPRQRWSSSFVLKDRTSSLTLSQYDLRLFRNDPGPPSWRTLPVLRRCPSTILVLVLDTPSHVRDDPN